MDDRTDAEGRPHESAGADNSGVGAGESTSNGDTMSRLQAQNRRLLEKLNSEPRARRPKEDSRIKRPLSKRSGGPRTKDGIARASNNSLKHGAYATRLPDHEDFCNYAEAARQELRPCGLIERTIVNSLAHDAYRIERIEEAERGRVLCASRHVMSPSALAELLDFPWACTHSELLLEPVNELLLQRAIHSAWVELAAPPPSPEPARPVSMPDRRLLGLYKEGCELLGRPVLLPFMHEDFFTRMDVVMHEARVTQSYLGRRISERTGEALLVQYWLYRNASRVNGIVHKVLQAQVLDVLGDENIARARSHVIGNIQRGMSSLMTARSLKAMDIEPVVAIAPAKQTRNKTAQGAR